MTGIRKRLGSLLGPAGRTPQFVQGQTTQLAPEQMAQASLVQINDAAYRVDFGIPEGREGRQGLPGVNAVPADEAVAAYLSDSGANTRHVADALYPTQRGQGVAPLRDVTTPALIGDGHFPIGVIDGVLYGGSFSNHRQVFTSNNSGGSWDLAATLPSSSTSLRKIWATGDGEVIVQNFTQLWRSTGWGDGPSSATWDMVLGTSPRVTQFAAWSVDVRGHRVIAADYGTYENQPWRVWVSTDYGQTFTLSLDLEDHYTTEQLADTHFHGVTIDPWRNVLYATNGDNASCNIWYSRDDGETWQTINHEWAHKRHTALCAMPEGILIGSDDGGADTPDGVYRINPDNPEDITLIHKIDTGEPGLRLIGASSTISDDGVMWMTMYPHSVQNQESVLMASVSGAQVHEVWRDPESDPDNGYDRRLYAVFGPDKNGWMHGRITSTQHNGWAFRARYARAGTPESQEPVHAGETHDPSSVSVHMKAGANRRSVAVGAHAEAGTTQQDSIDTIAIGYQAKAGLESPAPGAIAIGPEAESSGPNSITIGRQSSGTSNAVTIGYRASAIAAAVAIGFNAYSNRSVVVGESSESQFERGTVVGRQAETESVDAIAVGHSASAGFQSVAIGNNARAVHAGSAAIGHNQTTTNPNQLQVGRRHIEFQSMDGVFPPDQGSGRMFTRENSDGKTELCVRFALSDPIVIATQP